MRMHPFEMTRHPRLPAAALAAAALALLAALPRAAAHGFLAMPAARNVIHSTYYPRAAAERDRYEESYWNYCPHCLAAGGPGQVSGGGSLTWPAGLNGFCGDMYYKDGAAPNVDTSRDHEAGGRFATGGRAASAPGRGGCLAAGRAARKRAGDGDCWCTHIRTCRRRPCAGEIGGTYEEGGVMKVQVGITAHHNGRFGFRICRVAAPAQGQTWVDAEKAQLTPECFNQVGGWRRRRRSRCVAGRWAARRGRWGRGAAACVLRAVCAVPGLPYTPARLVCVCCVLCSTF